MSPYELKPVRFVVPWNREKLSQTLYECLDTVGTDIIFTKVEGQGFERGGCSQHGEMLGVVIIDAVLREYKRQGAESSRKKSSMPSRKTYPLTASCGPVGQQYIDHASDTRLTGNVQCDHPRVPVSSPYARTRTLIHPSPGLQK